jgi:ankyrin repeat protein
MDPVSLSVTIAKGAWICGEGLYGFVNGNLSINDDIRMLHSESVALSKNAEGLGDMLSRPELAEFYDADLWEDAEAALDRCIAPLEELEDTLRGLKTSKSSRWSFGDIKRVIKGNMKEDQINRLRSQLHSHNLVLTGIQGRINVSVSSKGLLDLKHEFAQLRLDLQDRDTRKADPLSEKGRSEKGRSASGPGIAPGFLTTPPVANRRASYESRSRDAEPPPVPHRRASPQIRSEDRYTVPSSTTDRRRNQPRSRPHVQVRPPTFSSAMSGADCRRHGLADFEFWEERMGYSERDYREILEATFTPIHWAVMAGNYREVNQLLSRGYDIDHFSRSVSKHNMKMGLIEVAALEGDADMILWLHDHGASLRDRDNALHIASRFPEGFDAVKCLLTYGAQTHYRDTEGWDALHAAAAYDAVDTARLLLDNDADVHSITDDEETPLHLAARGSSPAMIRLLLGRGADLDARDAIMSLPLIWAGFNIEHGAAIAKILLSRGAPIDAEDDTGSTALYVACQEANEGVVEVLLAYGADTDIACDDCTPLAMAKFTESETTSIDTRRRLHRIIKMLERRGAYCCPKCP